MNIAILLSGGTGTRLGADVPKQYIRVADRMIITYSLERLLEHPKINGVVIVAEEEWRDLILQDVKQQYGKKRIPQDVKQQRGKNRIPQDIVQHGQNRIPQDVKQYAQNKIPQNMEYGQRNTDKIIGFAVPGITRQYSILNALNYIKYEWNTETDIINVLIHDAARPNLSSDMISQCIDALKEYEGVMPVLQMKDTIYESMNGSTVSGLLDRSKLFAGQAPEAFRFDLYYEANQRLLPDRLHQINGATEPAILAGMDVAMIPGDEHNYKITTKADLERFEQEIYKK